jgi:hypothetical protein
MASADSKGTCTTGAKQISEHLGAGFCFLLLQQKCLLGIWSQGPVSQPQPTQVKSQRINFQNEHPALSCMVMLFGLIETRDPELQHHQGKSTHFWTNPM